MQTTTSTLLAQGDIPEGWNGPATGADIKNPILGNLNNLSGLEFIQKLLSLAINVAFVVGAVIFFFMLLSGGIQWISSGGDKQAVESARGRITNALIGIVILFSAFAIVKLIGFFFGIDLLILDIGGLKI